MSFNQNNQNQGPPDLDKIINNFIRSILSKGNNSNQNPKKSSSWYGISFLLLLAFGVFLLFGFFTVEPAKQGVVTRFGAFNRTVSSGLNYHVPLIERVYQVDVANVYDFTYSSSMLTEDENIVFVELAVQYKVNDARAFLFDVVNPVNSIKEATASALRFVVGHTTLSDVLTTGRDKARSDITALLKETIANYSSGVEILDVVVQRATPPEQVKEAFDDAIKAQEDEQRYINQAQAYVKGIIPKANGLAKRIYEAAKAYEQEVIYTAESDVALFEELLVQYLLHPEVTSKRLYFDMMEKVLAKTTKVVMPKDNQNMMYLPIDKLIPNSQVQPNTKVRKGNYE